MRYIQKKQKTQKLQNHEQVARALIEAKANVDHQNNEGTTALALACSWGHEDCAVLLLQAGARSDVVDDWGETSLEIAQDGALPNALALMMP